MPTNKVDKIVENAWTEDDMKAAIAEANSSTRPLRAIAKDVSFSNLVFRVLGLSFKSGELIIKINE